MSTPNFDYSYPPLTGYLVKDIDILEVHNFSAIDWENILSHMNQLGRSQRLSRAELNENLFTESFKTNLFDKIPMLWEIEGTLRNAALQGRHIIHIRQLGLAGKSADEQAICFYVIALMIGFPLAANKVTGQVVWDIRKQINNDVLYQTFSEGSDEATYHTDTAFYNEPVKYFGLYCRKSASCGGGVNRFCNALALRDKLTREPDTSWMIKLMTERTAIFQVPTSFTKSGGIEAIEAKIFGYKPPVRLRLDSIESGFEIKNDLSGIALTTAIREFLRHVDKPENHIEMQLEEDSAIFVNNHELLHYRSSFIDYQRHLMRIWIKV